MSISCDKILLLVSTYLSFFGITHYRGQLCFTILFLLKFIFIKGIHINIWFFFNSPEPKAQVSFSDHNVSFVVFILVINFKHFLLLHNHWANFNQTCYKASLGERDSSLFKWRAPTFSKGTDNNKKVKIYWQNLKIFSRTTEPN